MMNVGVLSYSIGALFFLALTLVLLTGWRGRLQGGLLVFAAGVTTVWAGLLAVHAGFGVISMSVLQATETLRFFAWLVFLLRIIQQAESVPGLKARSVMFYTLSISLVVIPVVSPYLTNETIISVVGKYTLTGYLIFSIFGLWLVEILFRGTKPGERWGIKFLCLGIGGMFAYDFFMYSDALLFKQIDLDFWNARGVINALVVPLIAVAAARNTQWSLDINVSRGIVFQTATLIGAGGYLLIMAAAGYYIKSFGGEWGAVIQVVFLFGALVMLLALLFSGHLRARLKVSLSKHFFNYQYDYRQEWLRFTHALSRCKATSQPHECVIHAIAEIVESPGGMLWLRDDADAWCPIASSNMPVLVEAVESQNSALVQFLEQSKWVINLEEYHTNPGFYEGLVLPAWFAKLPRAWLVVPLIDQDQLSGMIILAQPRAQVEFNWELRDLLKTAACQAASYLAQLKAVEALAEARQFEGFNRLSAFALHDLKNLIAQQSLVVNSASRHKHNPAFIDDAVRVMTHSVEKMKRLMTLMHSGIPSDDPVSVNLVDAVRDAVDTLSGRQPTPRFQYPVEIEEVKIVVDRDRFSSMIENIIHNAQDSLQKEGFVCVRLSLNSGRCVLVVEDNGCGMDANFIRDRLFRPFDTTKGDTGMGIGAYESREYVRVLGGEINVVSEAGKGSTFTISLPIQFNVESTNNNSHEYKEAMG